MIGCDDIAIYDGVILKLKVLSSGLMLHPLGCCTAGNGLNNPKRVFRIFVRS